jgi:hypothetical protein
MSIISLVSKLGDPSIKHRTSWSIGSLKMMCIVKVSPCYKLHWILVKVSPTFLILVSSKFNPNKLILTFKKVIL